LGWGGGELNTHSALLEGFEHYAGDLFEDSSQSSERVKGVVLRDGERQLARPRCFRCRDMVSQGGMRHDIALEESYILRQWPKRATFCGVGGDGREPGRDAHV
jgi:hypothetical protein